MPENMSLERPMSKTDAKGGRNGGGHFEVVGRKEAKERQLQEEKI